MTTHLGQNVKGATPFDFARYAINCTTNDGISADLSEKGFICKTCRFTQDNNASMIFLVSGAINTTRVVVVIFTHQWLWLHHVSNNERFVIGAIQVKYSLYLTPKFHLLPVQRHWFYVGVHYTKYNVFHIVFECTIHNHILPTVIALHK